MSEPIPERAINGCQRDGNRDGDSASSSRKPLAQNRQQAFKLRNGQGNGEPSVPRIDAAGAFADLPKPGNDMGHAVADVPIIPDHGGPRKKTRQNPRATRKSPMGIDAFRV